PSVYFKKVSATGDLVVVDVMLHATMSPIAFDAFDLDLTFDPAIVQLGGTTSDPSFNQTPFCGHDRVTLEPTCACNTVTTDVCTLSSTTPCSLDADCPG